jgi:hypothetical protein
MPEGYFRRVAALTPTKFWINNPTREEAVWAIEQGAVGCTNNPSYPQKMVDHPEQSAHARAHLEAVVSEESDDDRAAIMHQARLVKEVAEIFRPMYEETEGRHGYVSIQGDPTRDEDTELIYEQSLENRELGPNIACKIPTTEAGMAAMERLFNPVPGYVIDELCEKLPDFRRGYLDDGLSLEEFEEFGPVQLFKSAFTTSWKRVLKDISEIRAGL